MNLFRHLVPAFLCGLLVAFVITHSVASADAPDTAAVVIPADEFARLKVEFAVMRRLVEDRNQLARELDAAKETLKVTRAKCT